MALPQPLCIDIQPSPRALNRILQKYSALDYPPYRDLWEAGPSLPSLRHLAWVFLALCDLLSRRPVMFKGLFCCEMVTLAYEKLRVPLFEGIK